MRYIKASQRKEISLQVTMTSSMDQEVPGLSRRKRILFTIQSKPFEDAEKTFFRNANEINEQSCLLSREDLNRLISIAKEVIGLDPWTDSVNADPQVIRVAIAVIQVYTNTYKLTALLFSHVFLILIGISLYDM